MAERPHGLGDFEPTFPFSAVAVPSGFVPGQSRAGEVPAWKRIDAFGDVLPERDRAALDASEARPISLDAYRALLDQGET